MGYPAKLLTEGETIAFETRPHWRSMIGPALVLLVTVAVAGFLLATLGSGTAQGYLRWAIVIVALLIVLAWFVRPLLAWLTTQYVFTSRRIITRTGIVARSGKDMPLSKVNDVSFQYTILERILACGTLTVSSASEDGEVVIRNVPKVEEIQREIYRLAEADHSRRATGS